MKKTYVKPMIQFEDFKISTSIAGDCAKKTGTPSEGTCAVSVPGMTGGSSFNIFLESVADCTTATIDGEYGYCYHAPTDSANLFNS